MDRFRIVIIDDEPIVCREIKRGLAKEPYIVETFGDGQSALQYLDRQPVDLVLCDLRLPDISGLDVLKAIRRKHPISEVILITGHGSVDSAVDAIHAGAFHYTTKPVKMTELRILINRALDKVTLVREKEALKQELYSPPPPPPPGSGPPK